MKKNNNENYENDLFINIVKISKEKSETGKLIRDILDLDDNKRIALVNEIVDKMKKNNEEQKLIEKHAKAAGVDVKVGWAKFAGGNVMNDALLSNSLQFASGGVGPLVTLWARTKGNLDVKAVSAINSMPLYLNTINPAVKSVRDFTEKDRIALPVIKSSIQAVILQMHAEKVYGAGKHDTLDRLTVSMAHPDATAAMLGGIGAFEVLGSAGLVFGPVMLRLAREPWE